MDDEIQAIRYQMSQTRAALAEKLNALENQVADTVNDATHAVHDTIATAKDAVHSSAETIKEAVHDSVQCVKNAVDISAQVQRHPVLMLGGAVATGYLGGRLLFHDDHDFVGALSNHSTNGDHSNLGEPIHSAQANGRAQSSERGWLQSLADTLAPELKDLKRLAIGSLFGLVRDLVKESAPTQLAPSLGHIADNVTRKMGGTPLDRPLFESQRPIGTSP